jgi:hypothetical protein
MWRLVVTELAPALAPMGSSRITSQVQLRTVGRDPQADERATRVDVVYCIV